MEIEVLTEKTKLDFFVDTNRLNGFIM